MLARTHFRKHGYIFLSQLTLSAVGFRFHLPFSPPASRGAETENKVEPVSWANMLQHTCTEIALFPVSAAVPAEAVRRSTVFSMSKLKGKELGIDGR